MRYRCYIYHVLSNKKAVIPSIILICVWLQQCVMKIQTMFIYNYKGYSSATVTMQSQAAITLGNNCG